MLNLKPKAKFAVISVFIVLAVGWFSWWRNRQQEATPVDNLFSVGERQLKSRDTLSKIDAQHGVSVEESAKPHQIPSVEQPPSTSEPETATSALQSDNLFVAFGVVNVHRDTSTDSERVTQALHGEAVKVINQRGSWVEVSLPDQFNYQGWVQQSALQNIPTNKSKNWVKRQIVAVPMAEVRTMPRQNAPVAVSLPLGTVVGVELPSTEGDFTSVQLVDGREGYITSTKLLDYAEREVSQVSSGSILETADQLIGQPYLWGGMTTPGVDCSGFIHTVFKVHGIRLHRDADLQYFSDGVSVAPDQLQPGDLVFFSTYASGPSHVGIYAGNRKFIHASSSGVGYSSLEDSYFSPRFLGAKRILQSS